MNINRGDYIAFTVIPYTILILLFFTDINVCVNAAFGVQPKNASAITIKPPTTESELEFEAGQNPLGGLVTKTKHGNINNKRTNNHPTLATEEPEIEAEEMTSPNPSSWTFGWPTSGIGLWGQPPQSTEGPEEIELPVNSGMVTVRPGTCRNFEDKEIDKKIILNHKGCQIEISQEDIIKKFGKPGGGPPSVHIRTFT